MDSIFQLDTVLIKVASRCNLDCTYCYVYHGEDTSWASQPKKLTTETIHNIASSLVEVSQNQDAGFAIVLHGGEPLLLGNEKLEMLLSLLREKLPSNKYPIGIQTNGLLINERFLNICNKYQANVSISIDGPELVNDIARIDLKGKSSFSRLLNGINEIKKHENSDFLFSGTLSVIQITSEPYAIYSFLKEEIKTPSMDFLLQDGNYEKFPINKSSFESTEYGEWLSKLFDLYINDDGNLKIRYFDDIIKLLVGGKNTKEGRGEVNFGIIIIETDGEIRKNDTLRTSYDGVDQFSNKPIVGKSKILDLLSSDEYREYTKLQHPNNKTCLDCEYLNVCGGGMPLYRWSKDNGFNNPSIYCNDHKYIIEHIKNKLHELGAFDV
jgi:uncharacterized protein